MRNIFFGCENLKSLHLLSSFNTPNVEYMDRILGGCTSQPKAHLKPRLRLKLRPTGGLTYDQSQP